MDSQQVGLQGSLCCIGGDHRAEGQVIEAVLAPPPGLPEGSYVSYSFCEEHLWPGQLPPGNYIVTLHVMKERVEDATAQR